MEAREANSSVQQHRERFRFGSTLLPPVLEMEHVEAACFDGWCPAAIHSRNQVGSHGAWFGNLRAGVICFGNCRCRLGYGSLRLPKR